MLLNIIYLRLESIWKQIVFIIIINIVNNDFIIEVININIKFYISSTKIVAIIIKFLIKFLFHNFIFLIKRCVLVKIIKKYRFIYIYKMF